MLLNERNFFSYLNNLKCFEHKPDVAVGVSGGPDSMALVFLISKWVKLKKGKLFALVFDHSIRLNSQEESYQVRKMLTDLKIDSYVVNVKKNKTIKKNMANARKNRFEGLINFCKKKNIIHLFLGHHLDDNLETFLIRKINGSNLEGLGSMKLITEFNNVQILRPLINASKQSILNFNKIKKINFINDPSNKDINYTRVKVRKFLENTNYKKLTTIDYSYLKMQIPNYKKMIWELFISSIVDIKSDKIKICFDKLMSYDDLIIDKHILLVLKFFLKENNQPKGSKINIFINLLKKPDFKIFNLSGVFIEKKLDLLIFYQK